MFPAELDFALGNKMNLITRTSCSFFLSHSYLLFRVLYKIPCCTENMMQGESLKNIKERIFQTLSLKEVVWKTNKCLEYEAELAKTVIVNFNIALFA